MGSDTRAGKGRKGATKREEAGRKLKVEAGEMEKLRRMRENSELERE